VIGGFEGLYHGVPVGYTQIYDPLTDSWSLGASLPEIVRSAAAGATTGISAPKRIYVVGGEQDMVACNYTQIYNIDNDSWMLGAQMPTARSSLSVAVVNDVLYAIGGSLGPMTPFMTTVEQYLPFGYSTPVSSVSSVDGNEPTASNVVLIVAVSIIVTVAGAGLLIYLKKRKG